MSFNALYTKEAVKEVDEILKSKSYYIMPDGKVTYSVITDTLDLTIKHLTD